MDWSYLGPSGAAVVIVWIFIRYFAPVLEELRKSIDKNTQVTNETFKFLRNLNGDLKEVVDKKRR